MIDNDVRTGFRSGERSRRSRQSRWVVPLITIALVGCTGDDDAVSTSTEFPSTTATPSTTEETVTTASPSTTGAATSTTTSPPTAPVSTTDGPSTTDSTSTTGSPTTTEVPSTNPTTTVLDLGPVETDVAAAYTAAFDAWTDCLEALPNCNLQSLVTNRTGAYLDNAVLQAGRYNDAGHTVENAKSRRATVESVEIVSPSQVNVIACEVDASVRRDGAGAVINDSFDSARALFVLVPEGGEWRISGSEDIEVGQDEGGNVCP